MEFKKKNSLAKIFWYSPGIETAFALGNCQLVCLWVAHWLKRISDEGF
jgi:hypothetical protein